MHSEVELIEILNILVTLLLGLVVFFLRQLYNRSQGTFKDVQDIKKSMAVMEERDRLIKDQFQSDIKDLRERVNKLEAV